MSGFMYILHYLQSVKALLITTEKRHSINLFILTTDYIVCIHTISPTNSTVYINKIVRFYSPWSWFKLFYIFIWFYSAFRNDKNKTKNIRLSKHFSRLYYVRGCCCKCGTGVPLSVGCPSKACRAATNIILVAKYCSTNINKGVLIWSLFLKEISSKYALLHGGTFYCNKI